MKNNNRSTFKISFFTFLFAIIWWIMGNGLMFVFYFVSLLLHEIAHAVVAKKLGYKTEKIVLSPLGATLYADTDEFTGKDELKIALAGPLFSAMLAIICVCVWWIYPESYNFSLDFCMANFSIFLLNMLPIFPLDGGRVLSSKLSTFWPRNKVAKLLNTIAIIFGLCLICLTIFSMFGQFNYSYAVIGCFLIASVCSGGKENSYKRVLNLAVKAKKLKRGIVKTQLMVPRSMSLSKVFTLLDSNSYYELCVVDEKFNTLFTVDESRFVELLKMYPASTQIGEVHIDKSRFGW